MRIAPRRDRSSVGSLLAMALPILRDEISLAYFRIIQNNVCMAGHTAYRDWGVAKLEGHISSLHRLARLTRNLRDQLDETAKKLDCEYREATTAYRLAARGDERPSWKASIRLGPTKELLTVRELAVALGVTATTVGAMVKDGRLPAPTKESRRCIFQRSAIDAWVGDRGDD